MKKEVIYIDGDDDITAIIGKVKGAKEKIIALVPPKKIEILQSAVNLQLLARAARGTNKNLVIITNNQALSELAASAKIPVAKNLQSKPGIAKISALSIDNDDDIIDGSNLPVGDHAALATGRDGVSSTKKLDETTPLPSIDLSDEPAKVLAASTDTETKSQPKKGAKVPDFNKFRKKIVLIGAAVLLFGGFLVWAIFFAPRATVVISARTSPERFNQEVALGSETSVENNVIRTSTQEIKRDVTVEFEATGTEERGERASGVLTLSQSGESTPIDVPAGTGFSNGNLTFVTNEAVRVPGASVSGGSIVPGQVDVRVTAAAIGSDYNLSARSYQSSVTGVAAYGGPMTGGSKREIKIVTADDVQRASQRLVEQEDTEAEEQLRGNFSDEYIIISDSMTADRSEAVSSPAIGDEARDGEATLTSSVTYSLRGVSKSDIESFLSAKFEESINDDSQRLYSTGGEDVDFRDYQPGSAPRVVMAATGQVGPNIDDEDVKQRSASKRYGDVQSELESINGVDEVDVRFWPFWVRKVPGNHDKISVEFDLRDGQN